MSRNTTLHILRTLAAVACAAAMSAIPTAQAGGRGGGDSGDSSMNPFTGDSYAYFHGGHNLGEQGTIRPNRPNPAWSVESRIDPNPKAVSRDPTPSPAPKRVTPDQATTR